MATFVCDICEDRFTSLNDYIAHLQEHKAEQDKQENAAKEFKLKKNMALAAIRQDVTALQDKISEFNKTYIGTTRLKLDFSESEVSKKDISKPACVGASNFEDILLKALNETPEEDNESFSEYMDKINKKIDKSKLTKEELKELNALDSLVRFFDSIIL